MRCPPLQTIDGGTRSSTTSTSRSVDGKVQAGAAAAALFSIERRVGEGYARLASKYHFMAEVNGIKFTFTAVAEHRVLRYIGLVKSEICLEHTQSSAVREGLSEHTDRYK